MGNEARKKFRLVPRLLTGLTWATALVVLIPFVWMLILSFKSNQQILNEPFALPTGLDFINFKRAFQIMPLVGMYKNTFIIAVFTQIICLVSTFMCSFALSRLIFKHKKIQNMMYIFLLTGLMIPTYILLFPIYRINISLKLVNTYAGIILPLAASSVSFNTLMFVSHMKSFPKEIEEAALIDGCGVMRLCTSITLPIERPVILTVTVFNVLYVWNEFPLQVTLIQNPVMRTISMGVSMFRNQYGVDYGGLVAGTLIILLPQLIFYIGCQKYVVGGMTVGAIKG